MLPQYPRTNTHELIPSIGIRHQEDLHLDSHWPKLYEFSHLHSLIVEFSSHNMHPFTVTSLIRGGTLLIWNAHQSYISAQEHVSQTTFLSWVKLNKMKEHCIVARLLESDILAELIDRLECAASITQLDPVT